MNRWITYGANKIGCSGQVTNLQGVQVLSLEDCKALCTATTNCNSLFWNSKDDACWIREKPDACTDTPCDWNSGDDTKHWYWLACGGVMLCLLLVRI